MYDRLIIWDNIQTGFSSNTLLLINIVFILVMFGFGLRMDIPSYLKKETLKIKPLLVGLCCQIILVPAVICFILILLNNVIPVFTALGILFAACCPISSRVLSFSKRMKVDAHLVESAWGLSTLLCFFTLPLTYSYWGSLLIRFLEQGADSLLYITHVDFLYFFRAFFLIMLIPISLGVLIHNHKPKQTASLARPILLFANTFWIILALLTLISNYKLLVPRLPYFFMIAIGFQIITSFLGVFVCAITRCSAIDKRSVRLMTSFFGTGFGLSVIFNNYIFPQETIYTNQYFVLAFLTLWNAFAGIVNVWFLKKYDEHNERKVFSTNL